MRGPRPRDVVAQTRYNAADVAAIPNREIDADTEGFGMVFLEAAACGKPTVAGLAGGTGAAVIDGVTGFRGPSPMRWAACSGIRRWRRKWGGDGYARALRDPPGSSWRRRRER